MEGAAFLFAKKSAHPLPYGAGPGFGLINGGSPASGEIENA
jgi:hypothetical protein